MKAISPAGTPFFTSLSRISSYTLNVPSPFGVDKSQKINCVDLCAIVFSQILKAFSTHAAAFEFSLSGSRSFTSLWSRASFLPSFVILSILSWFGSTRLLRTASARSARDCTISFWCSLGLRTTFSYCTSGTGSFSISAVWMSAHSLNIDISSGRL